MNAEIITVTTQKGGTGKTTTAKELAYYLSEQGYKVLLIDMDPQASLTVSMSADIGHTCPKMDGSLKEARAADYLTGRDPIRSAIIAGKGSPDFLPADESLIILQDQSARDESKQRYLMLKKAIEPVKKYYEYIVIDTPPALSMLTLNALQACTGVIIPSKPDIYGLHGLAEVVKTIEAVRLNGNPSLRIDGILLQMMNSRATFYNDMRVQFNIIAEAFKTKVFNTTIRASVTADEAIAFHTTIRRLKPGSPLAADYTKWLNEYEAERKKG